MRSKEGVIGRREDRDRQRGWKQKIKAKRGNFERLFGEGDLCLFLVSIRRVTRTEQPMTVGHTS